MAHHMKIKVLPHRNQNGTDSKTKKDYVVIDRARKESRLIGTLSSKSAAELAVEKYRGELSLRHVEKHPKDRAFLNKFAAFKIKKRK